MDKQQIGVLALGGITKYKVRSLEAFVIKSFFSHFILAPLDFLLYPSYLNVSFLYSCRTAPDLHRCFPILLRFTCALIY